MDKIKRNETRDALRALALALLAVAALVFLGLWIFAGQLHPVAFCAISASALLIRRPGSRRVVTVRRVRRRR